MRKLRNRWTLLCAALVAVPIAPAQAYIASSRWSRTATNSSTGPWGNPITLTWSFAPDGTSIPGNTSGTTTPSNLLSFLDTNWGIGPGGNDLTQRPWFPIFQQSYDRISALSGVTYVYEPKDDKRNFSNTTLGRGVLGTRGDIRLGGKSYGSGSNTLASNFYPDYGEMMVNTDKASFFLNSANNYRAFRNTLMHESMHGLGIDHVESSNAGILIEPFLSTAFDGPQLDDLLAIQRLYGDVYEKNGGNDVYSKATPLGMVSPAQPLAKGSLGDSTVILSSQTDFLSIDDDSDTDYFSFSLRSRLDVSLQLTPRGSSYLIAPQTDPPTTQTTLNTLTLSNLTLALVDSNGTSILDYTNSNGAGLGESISRQLLPGTYYARVKGTNNDIQLYGLDISASTPAPNQLLWVGNLGQNWDEATTANFANGGAPSLFYAADHVTFDDSSNVKTVSLASSISAGDVLVETADRYVFTGPGGLVDGSLTVDGAGTLELANGGNSYAGDTQVLAGTLAVTGNAIAMHSAITVAAGATLLMDATDAATMSSSFTIDVGGTLDIGTLATSANVFPDAPTAVVNDGVIRVYASETLRSVSGGGAIVAENGTTSLAANPSFAGTLAVKAGAVARVDDGEGLGTAAATATVAGGGLLQLAGDSTTSQAIQLDADATLQLDAGSQFDSTARLTGQGQVVGSLTMPGTIVPGNSDSSVGSLSLSADLALADTSRLEFRLGGLAAGTDFATLHAEGAALLAGSLQVALANDFMPSPNDVFELLTAAGGVSGIFDTIDLPLLEPDFHWDLIYDAQSLVLKVAANTVLLPGDFNLDGTVDAADYTVWRDSLGQTGTGLAADGDGDGEITTADYDIWKSDFVVFTGGGLASHHPNAATVVPELACLPLAVTGGVLIGLGRGFRRRMAAADCLRSRGRSAEGKVDDGWKTSQPIDSFDASN